MTLLIWQLQSNNLKSAKLYFLELYSGAADLCLVSWRAIKPTTVPDYGLVLANKAGQLSPTTAKQCYNVQKHASNTVNNSNTVTVTVTQPSYAVTGQWIKHRLRPGLYFLPVSITHSQ